MKHRRPIAAAVAHGEFAGRLQGLVGLAEVGPTRGVKHFDGRRAHGGRLRGDSGGGADHEIKRGKKRAGAVDLLFLIDLWRDMHGAAHRMGQGLNLVRRGVVLHAHKLTRQALGKPCPSLKRRILHPAHAGNISAAPAQAGVRAFADGSKPR